MNETSNSSTPIATPTQRIGRRRLTATPPLLLSDRAAASLLGVSRTTIADLRRSRRLRAVKWVGGFRIPLEEVQRLAREGLAEVGTRTSHKRRASPAMPSDPGAAIRGIDVEALP